MHFIADAFDLARPKVGRSMPARMAMMAMTTREFNQGERVAPNLIRRREPQKGSGDSYPQPGRSSAGRSFEDMFPRYWF